ncbi:MAG: nucleotidyltransferase family protein [Candidatus Freyrarchaeum guaymaensis]
MSETSERLMTAAFDLARRLSDVEGVELVVLFGSVARGEADRRSDVDIAIILDTHAGDEAKEKVSSIALDVEKEFNVPVQTVITNRRFEKVDSYFVKKLLDEGIILYGRPLLLEGPIVLEPYTIFSYSLRGLSQADKMRVKRVLYGYETRKKVGEKVYVSAFKGVIEEARGKKLGPASLLVPRREAGKLEEILSGLGATYKTINVWLPVES